MKEETLEHCRWSLVIGHWESYGERSLVSYRKSTELIKVIELPDHVT